jgi:hypothetical protein
LSQLLAHAVKPTLRVLLLLLLLLMMMMMPLLQVLSGSTTMWLAPYRSCCRE